MSGLVDIVSRSPAHVKRLTPDELTQLAGEMRERIIDAVATNGGHLGANLGVVELTIALMATLDLPRDEIVWDVGHQCYPYKLLTGRADRFGTLRRLGGLAGFPRRDESPYDSFGTGHSSTSISAALGKAKARDLRGEPSRIVAVIGDGALTGGLALEGLNSAARCTKKLLVVLNDNTMSIDENVGAYSRYLNRIRTQRFYRDNRDYARDLIKSIPGVGDRLYRLVARMEGSLKYLVVPGVVFEEMGFTYLGPVDGHDVGLLRDTFAMALEQTSKPVLVHVKTTKGKGYSPAEDNQPLFHGTGPFDKANGVVRHAAGPPSYTEVLGEAVLRAAERDDRLVAITAAMASGTGLVPFSRRFPDRYVDVGIAEQHAVTLAAGLASRGLRPLVAVYSTFLQRAYDQILHDVALQALPVTFALDRAGLVGEDGATHHGVFDLSYLRHIPNLVVMAPCDGVELGAMLDLALTHPGPVAIRYPRGAVPAATVPAATVPAATVPAATVPPASVAVGAIPASAADEGPCRYWGPGLGRAPLVIGRGEVLREGADVTIFAVGAMVEPAVAAAELLSGEGVAARVVNARFVKPLDVDLLLRCVATGAPLLTVEENVLAGGFGSAVLEALEAAGVEARVARLGVPDRFVAHGAVAELRAQCGLDVAGIRARVLRFLGRGLTGGEVAGGPGRALATGA